MLLGGLDALGHDAHFRFFANCAIDVTIRSLCREVAKLADEKPVDLDAIEREN